MPLQFEVTVDGETYRVRWERSGSGGFWWITNPRKLTGARTAGSLLRGARYHGDTGPVFQACLDAGLESAKRRMKRWEN